MSPRIIAIVQARMGSTRLRGKVLMEIAGEPMLERVLQRTSRSESLDEVLVATTTEAADDGLVEYCKSRSWPCFRGSQYDVLERYLDAARFAQADIVVRVTADCPLIDGGLLDETVRVLLTGKALPEGTAGPSHRAVYDFAANRLPPPWKRTYPIGLDVEACTFPSLERAWREATEPQQREHVMPYLYEGVELAARPDGLLVGTSPRGFRVALLECPADYGKYRWTVDTAEDLDFVRGVYGYLGHLETFAWTDVLALVQSHPELAELNAAITHKSLRDVDERATQDRSS